MHSLSSLRAKSALALVASAALVALPVSSMAYAVTPAVGHLRAEPAAPAPDPAAPTGPAAPITPDAPVDPAAPGDPAKPAAFAVKTAPSAGQGAAIRAENGRWSVKYDVTVTNVGGTEGKAPAVYEFPAMASAVTVTSAEVDGKPTSRGTDLRYPVLAADTLTLAPQQSSVLTVTFSGTFDVQQFQDDREGTCGTPGGGLYAAVEMDGDETADPEGVKNNVACLPILPQAPDISALFRREPQVADPTAVADDSTFKLAFQVVLTNNSAQTALTEPIKFAFDLPAGVTLTKATYENNAIALVGTGTSTSKPVFTAPRRDISGSGTVDLQLSVTGTVDPAKADWSALEKCGIVATLQMELDADGIGNNTACVSLAKKERMPQIDAAYEAADQGAPVYVGADGAFNAAFDFTVTNRGPIDYTFPTHGFWAYGPKAATAMESITVDGMPPVEEGNLFGETHTRMGAVPGIALHPGETRVMHVVYSGHLDRSKLPEGFTSQCTDEVSSIDEISAVYSQIEVLENGENGTGTLIACVPFTFDAPQAPTDAPTPTTVPVPTTEPVEPALPETGADSVLPLALGSSALVAGGLVLMAMRRRARS